MKKTLILTALAVIGFVTAPSLVAQNFDLITLTNVPTGTGHTATNANTNFNSQAISPNGQDLKFWIKFTGTNATSTGTLVFTLLGAPDRTNYQSSALATFTGTYNGTNPVITPFFIAATNFVGVANVKFSAVTNISTNFGTIQWIKAAVPR